MALLLSLFVVPGAVGASTSPVYDSQGRLVEVPFVPAPPEPELDSDRAIGIALAHTKIRDWVARYPGSGLTKTATFQKDKNGWEVKVWSTLPDAGQIVLATVDDATQQVTEAWTGPQVAWGMARGYKGLFGRQLNNPEIWWPLCAVFFLGLANLRRPLSMRNLDLLALIGFSASWWFFNRGEVFTSVPLAYPVLVYLLLRAAWIGARDRGPQAARPVWPVWLLVVATVFLFGFRVGLNLTAREPAVIDVGFASVVGAQRIVGEGQAPYGHMPVRDRERCDIEGSYGTEAVQTNGRCEAAVERGDTYGPVTYIAYIPGYLAFGWSGGWDNLPAAHFTSLLVDAFCLIGLALVGWRFGRGRLAATLAFAWVSYPFTQYVSNANSNDAIVPAILIFGFWLSTSALSRGLTVGLASFAKYAALLLAPLWASYPSGLRRPRAVVLFAGGFLLATALSFWVLLLEPDPLHAAGVFWDRTFGWQLGRDSPFSIWDWAVYPGYPDLSVYQTGLKIALVVTAVAVAFAPRRKSPLQLAALSAMLLIGFEIVLTHWFYLYIPWFFPFAIFALLAPAARRAERQVEETGDRQIRELVGAQA
jgi:hypothetical protein